MKTLLTSLSAALLLSACGGGTTCEDIGRQICAEACACTEGDSCALGNEAEGGAFTISFDAQGDCEAFYVVLGCSGGGDPSIDLDACSAALDAAACFDTGDGTEALSFPETECTGDDA